MLDRPYLKQQAKGLLQVSKPSALLAGGIYTALSAVMSFLSLRLIGMSGEVAERAYLYYTARQYETALAVLAAAQPSAASWLIDLALDLVMLIVGVGEQTHYQRAQRRAFHAGSELFRMDILKHGPLYRIFGLCLGHALYGSDACTVL